MWQNKSLQMIAPIKPICAKYFRPETRALFTITFKFIDGFIIVTPVIIVLCIAIEDPFVPLMNNSSWHNSPDVIDTLSCLFEFEVAILSVL